jgi:hypothetical protein
MDQTLTLNITQEDYDKSGDYVSNYDCLLATAAKREFNTNKVYAMVSRIRINGVWYFHEMFGPSEHIERMSDKKPFTIILNKSEHQSFYQ